jgi:acyl-coenzyme A thioesterase PaaI-like protein
MSQSTQLHHYPRCYGCGAANSSGLKLTGEWNGSEGVITHVPPDSAEGGPGVVHGGYVAALADEAMALVASQVSGYPAMTRRIELDFRAPTLTGLPLVIRVWVDQDRSRALILGLRGQQGEPERTCFEAKGVYIKVEASVWAHQMVASNRTDEKLELGGGDPSNYFQWQLRGLTSVFDPGESLREMRVVVVVSDVVPPEWTITVSQSGVDARQGISEPYDAMLECTFDQWRELAHDRSLRVSALADAGDLVVGGDISAAEEFFALLHRHRLRLRGESHG